jgi:hypothetical protein
MAELVFTADISFRGGPKFVANRVIAVEAYDIVEVTIPAGSTDVEVDALPGGSGSVCFLAVLSDWFGEDLSYKINSAANPARTLDEPHVFSGKGAVSIFDANPQKLFFSNATSGPDSKDAHVRILVGRDATP